MTEPRDAKIKRLRMRSMRRGIREMDLILSAYADATLADMSDEELDHYDALLTENDHDIYGWIGGQLPTPARYTDLVGRIAAGAFGVTRSR